jgi:hypothetical protein
MTPEEQAQRQERYRKFMTDDFGVNTAGQQAVIDPAHKVSNALEYIAYQMGQINRNLARLVDHLDKQAK